MARGKALSEAKTETRTGSRIALAKIILATSNSGEKKKTFKMFAKALPLDFNNHNYMYNIVLANKNITNTDEEIVFETIDRDCILDPTLCTDGKVDKVKENTWLLIHVGYFHLCVLLVYILVYIIKSLMKIVPEAWCSNSASKKFPLLKIPKNKNYNTIKPPKVV